MKRKRNPNILVTGTIGAGKTFLCRKLLDQLDLKYLEIREVAIANNFLKTFDEIYQCPMLDEQKMIEGLEDQMEVGGNIVEYHSCLLFPKKWFDMVIVVRSNNKILYERLEKRGCKKILLRHSVESEMCNDSMEEAKSCFKTCLVRQVASNCPEDLDGIVEYVKQWYQHQLRIKI